MKYLQHKQSPIQSSPVKVGLPAIAVAAKVGHLFPKGQPPSRRSGALARREGGRTGAFQNASRHSQIAQQRASVLDCGDPPPLQAPPNPVKVCQSLSNQSACIVVSGGGIILHN